MSHTIQLDLTPDELARLREHLAALPVEQLLAGRLASVGAKADEAFELAEARPVGGYQRQSIHAHVRQRGRICEINMTVEAVDLCPATFADLVNTLTSVPLSIAQAGEITADPSRIEPLHMRLSPRIETPCEPGPLV